MYYASSEKSARALSCAAEHTPRELLRACGTLLHEGLRYTRGC